MFAVCIAVFVNIGKELELAQENVYFGYVKLPRLGPAGGTTVEMQLLLMHHGAPR